MARASCAAVRAKNPGKPFIRPSSKWIRRRGVSPLSRNSKRSISFQRQRYVRQRLRALTPDPSRIIPLMGIRNDKMITPIAIRAGTIATGRPTCIALTTIETPTKPTPEAQSQSRYRRQSLTRIIRPSWRRADEVEVFCTFSSEACIASAILGRSGAVC